MSGGKIKVTKNGKLYFSRTVTDGPVQRAFANKIGNKVGSCVKAKTEGKSHTKGEKLDILKKCMSDNGIKKGMTLGVFRENSYYRRKERGEIGGGRTI